MKCPHVELLLHKLKCTADLEKEYLSFWGVTLLQAPKVISYIIIILGQIIMSKFDKNLKRYLILLIWSQEKVERGGHSPQNYKVIFVKDISGYGILSS